MITVTDAVTGQPICDATVAAHCDDGGAALAAFSPSGHETDATVPGCNYAEIGGLCGQEWPTIVATLSVSKTGYKTITVPEVEVRFSKKCPGPIPEAQHVNVKLEPL